MAPRTKQLFAGFDPDDLATAHRVLAQVVERADQLRRGTPGTNEGL